MQCWCMCIRIDHLPISLPACLQGFGYGSCTFTCTCVAHALLCDLQIVQLLCVHAVCNHIIEIPLANQWYYSLEMMFGPVRNLTIPSASQSVQICRQSRPGLLACFELRAAVDRRSSASAHLCVDLNALLAMKNAFACRARNGMQR